MNRGSLVNSHNEWDPLEEVIVGRGLPTTFPAIDFTFRLFFHDNIYNVYRTCGHDSLLKESPQHYINKRHVSEHEEDVENFAELLASHNITVRRPKVPSRIHKVKTPNWDSTIFPALNVRDLTMIVGDKIIETPPSLRFRYFETDYMKHLFLEYFKGGAEWLVAPRPLMLDESFDLEYYEKDMHAVEQYKQMQHKSYMECGHEIMFDAANCMRLGKHILFNASTTNTRMGADWLQRALGEQYTVWRTNITDTHIDSTFLPLRPGLALLLNSDKKELLPEPLQKWDLISIPLRERTDRFLKSQSIPLASPRIELNVFSIDPNTIICHPEYRDTLKSALSQYKIEVIPCQMRHCEIFSGAHHCLTLDVRRKGKLENYFNET